MLKGKELSDLKKWNSLILKLVDNFKESNYNKIIDFLQTKKYDSNNSIIDKILNEKDNNNHDILLKQLNANKNIDYNLLGIYANYSVFLIIWKNFVSQKKK